MPLEQVAYTKAHTTGGRSSLLATLGAAHAFRLHARCLVVLFAATACLAPAAPVRAQHPAQHGASAQGAAKTHAADDASMRPFHINVPEEALVDLRRRIAATRWSDRETVKERSQGVQLAMMQALVRYWGTDYDWWKAERRSDHCGNRRYVEHGAHCARFPRDTRQPRLTSDWRETHGRRH
jgi:Epoxide hydrolase N terminus